MVSGNIGHYRVLEVLGEGGMGTVYRAHDEQLHRDVAIKLLKDRGDLQAVRRFVREARAASALNHPNIVTVFEVGEAEQGHFIVMELVRGRVLRAMLGRPVDMKSVVTVVRQIAEALSVAHDAGIVHRDLKPENVMLRDDGYVKVLDFGIARPSLQRSSNSTTEEVLSTASHTILGTVRYMSPEQAAGGTVDTPSDIFSLGVVFYELASGRHPFDASTSYGVLHAILDHAPVLPSRLNPELSSPLEALLLSMLEKDARLRPTAGEVAAALASPESDVSLRKTGSASGTSHYSVGRLKARAELRAAFDIARRGHGLLVYVSGEAGIGKTMLVADFLAEGLQPRGACYVGRGRCSERLAGTEAYLPVLDALEDLLRGDDGSLGRAMKSLAPQWYRQIVPLAPLDVPAEAAGQAGTQERLKRELLAFFEEVCRRKPLVLFFDDLHWVDVSTVDVLSYIARHFQSLPMLVVVTYRTDEMVLQKHPFLAMKRDLQGRGDAREIVLEFLTRSNVDQYVALKYPQHRLPSTFIDLVYERTEGNPLFVVSLLEYLVDQHVLVPDDGGWSLGRPLAEVAGQLPESIREMIQRKIDRLADADRHVLLAASVQGYEFDAAVAAAVAGVEPADAEEQLDALDRFHGLTRRVRETELPDRTVTLRYRFVHALYQNMLYASLTPARRASLSRAVGGALERFHRGHTDAIASELAALYETAREFAQAAHYFHLAARNAASVFAYEEAFVLGSRALEALRMLPADVDRSRLELALLLLIAQPASASRGYSSPEAQRIYDRAGALCIELNQTRELAQILYMTTALCSVRLELDSARDAAHRLNSIVGDGQDPAVRVEAIVGPALVDYYSGNFSGALARHQEVVRAEVGMDLRRTILRTAGFDPVASSLSYMAWERWCLGYPDQAARDAAAAEEVAGELGHRYALVLALTFAATLHSWRGDWDRAKACNDRALAGASEHGFAYFQLTGMCLDAVYMLRTERQDAGLARLREGLDRLRAIGGRASSRRFIGDYARQMALAGSVDAALELLTKEIADIGEARFWEAELVRTRGELLAARHSERDMAEAEQCFARAIRVATDQKARGFELRAATSLVRFLDARGRPTQAASHLSQVYRWFTEGFDTADLVEARELLRKVENVDGPSG